ncbi:MAG: TspO/MBR family protein [Candidatus Gastranaerophilaceae bacterium]
MNYDEDWYNSLIKPKFQPPAWIFAPVWALLYVLMFIAIVLVLMAKFRLINILGYLLFAAQLYINISWPEAFFKEHDLRKAFLLCALLTLLVFLTMIVFFYISGLAALLFLPYFLWCIFASTLSFEILELNEE